MRDIVTSRVPWRTVLVVGMVALLGAPGGLLSQQADSPKPEKPGSAEKVDLQRTPVQIEDVSLDLAADVLFELADDPAKGGPKGGDRLDRLEKELERLLQEVKALRGEKSQDKPGVKKGEEKRVIIQARPAEGEKKPVNEEKRITIHATAPGGPKKPDNAQKRIELKGEIEPRMEKVFIIADDKVPGGPGEKPKVVEVHEGTGKIMARDFVVRNLEERESNATILSRATYKMPKAKAESLAAFLKDQVKGQVLETMIKEDGIVITTTPEAQRIIGQFLGLVQGHPLRVNLQFHIDDKGNKSTGVIQKGELIIEGNKSPAK